MWHDDGLGAFLRPGLQPEQFACFYGGGGVAGWVYGAPPVWLLQEYIRHLLVQIEVRVPSPDPGRNTTTPQTQHAI